MPLALVLKLQPTTEATVPSFLGRAAHAWFLDQLRQQDARLSRKYHENNQSRPFTVSSLWCPGIRPKNGLLHLSPRRMCYLRVTSIDPALTAIMQNDCILRWKQKVMHLVGVPFRVIEVASTSHQHKQASCYTYRELKDKVEESSPPERITLRFLSPTVFRRSPPKDSVFQNEAYNLPLPIPELLFSGLLSLWNNPGWNPEAALPAQLPAFVRDCVVISRYNLYTDLVKFGSGRRGHVGGFKGECHFSIRCADPTWRRQIGFLASFAPFAGVGWRTTMGLGQVQIVDETW